MLEANRITFLDIILLLLDIRRGVILNPDKKLTQHKLTVLQLAKAIESVPQNNLPRRVFYTHVNENKGRFQTNYIERMKDQLSILNDHTVNHPIEVVEHQLLYLAIKLPFYDCNQLEALLMVIILMSVMSKSRKYGYCYVYTNF